LPFIQKGRGHLEQRFARIPGQVKHLQLGFERREQRFSFDGTFAFCCMRKYLPMVARQ
jgi:hypothetical protein